MSGVFFARPCELGGAGVVQGIGLTPRLVPCLLVWHPGFLSDLRSSRVSPFPVLVFQEGSIRTFAVPGLPRSLFWSFRRVPFRLSQFPSFPVSCSGLPGGVPVPQFWPMYSPFFTSASRAHSCSSVPAPGLPRLPVPLPRFISVFQLRIAVRPFAVPVSQERSLGLSWFPGFPVRHSCLSGGSLQAFLVPGFPRLPVGLSRRYLSGLSELQVSLFSIGLSRSFFLFAISGCVLIRSCSGCPPRTLRRASLDSFRNPSGLTSLLPFSVSGLPLLPFQVAVHFPFPSRKKVKCPGREGWSLSCSRRNYARLLIYFIRR